jgi:hypothetical protein
MAETSTTQTSRQGRPIWLSWLGVLGLLVVHFGVFWVMLAFGALGSSATREVTRVTNDGALGFSAAEWSDSFRLTWSRSLLWTATLLGACVLGFALRWAWDRRGRSNASA